MDAEKVITYLQMTSPGQLRWARAVEGVSLIPVVDPGGDDASQLRELHDRVGAAHGWSSLAWSHRQWIDWLGDPSLRHWWITVGDTLAGWGCLRWHPGPEAELDTFGLVPECIGLGYGGYALSLLTQAAWTLPEPTNAAGAAVQRVWLHTSSRDHPHALENYRARGFVPVADCQRSVTARATPDGDAAVLEAGESGGISSRTGRRAGANAIAPMAPADDREARG